MSAAGLSIAFLLESTVLCGGVKVVFNLASALAAKGCQVYVLSSDTAASWFRGQLNFIVQNPFDADIVNRFELVVATTYRLAWTHAKYIEAGRLWHLVQGFEGDYFECGHLLEDIDQAYLLQIPKITISRDLARRLAARYPNNTFVSIGQGLEKDYFYPAQDWVQQIQVRPSSLFLVGAASISIKQVKLGLQAYALARRQYTDLKLVRISTVDTRDQEENIVGNISEYHVHIPPERIGKLFRARHGLLLAPSGPGEGFGLPPLEAMACAVPVVMSNIPSFTAFALPVDYARFVRHDDPEDMAAGICELIADQEKREYLARRGLQVTASYDFDSVASRLLGVLSKGKALRRGG